MSSVTMLAERQDIEVVVDTMRTVPARREFARDGIAVQPRQITGVGDAAFGILATGHADTDGGRLAEPFDGIAQPRNQLRPLRVVPGGECFARANLAVRDQSHPGVRSTDVDADYAAHAKVMSATTSATARRYQYWY